MRLLYSISFLFSFHFGYSQAVTYYGHIAPIVQKNCVECHQKGGVAPMAFTDYEKVSSYGAMIKYVTGIRYMPPWKVIKPINHFKTERGLTDEEIDLIKLWVDGGLKEGDPQNSSFAAKNDKSKTISEPDVVISMAEAFEQYGVYYDQFRVFVIPTNFGEDREIESIVFVPGNETIVRGCSISIDTSKKSKALDDWDPQYGYFSFGALGFVPMESRWYNWHPGKPVTNFPKGSGKLLPKKSKLLFHMHYGPTGVPKKDSSFLQIKFAREKVSRPLFTAPLLHPHNMTNKEFVITAEDSVRVHAKFVVPFDLELYGVYPQSHLLGKKWEIFSVDPEKKDSGVLLKIEEWDFKWRQMYDFKTPRILKKGTVIHALATYDNTLDNLSNPSNPPREMKWGKRMFEEMFLVFFKYSEYRESDAGCDFSIGMNQVNITNPLFEFDVLLSHRGNYSCWVKSFDGKECLPLFENEKFKKGKHAMDVDLSRQGKGNYFIEVLDDESGVATRRIFVYLDDVDFE